MSTRLAAWSVARLATVRAAGTSGGSQPQVSQRCVHSAAKHGFTAQSAESYETGRPSYSDDCLNKVTEILSPDQQGLQLLELGSGTGKFTESFSRYYRKVMSHNPDSLRYIATEPLKGFRDKLVSRQLPNVSVLDGTGHAIPAKAKELDGVVAAQAFHWMADETTLKEVHRVLKASRPLILLWNTYDLSEDWLQQVSDKVLDPAYDDDVPRQQNGKWRDCFGSIVGKQLFGPLEFWSQRFIHAGDRQMVMDRVLSTSVIVGQSEEMKAKTVTTMNKILDTHPALEASRASNVYNIIYKTEIAWTYAK